MDIRGWKSRDSSRAKRLVKPLSAITWKADQVPMSRPRALGMWLKNSMVGSAYCLLLTVITKY